VRQRRLRVTVTPEHTEYQLREGDPLRIVHDGEDVSVSTDALVRRPTGRTPPSEPPVQPLGRAPIRTRGGP
jgi:alpha,alpha-trehalose phosphorylase